MEKPSRVLSWKKDLHTYYVWLHPNTWQYWDKFNQNCKIVLITRCAFILSRWCLTSYFLDQWTKCKQLPIHLTETCSSNDFIEHTSANIWGYWNWRKAHRRQNRSSTLCEESTELNEINETMWNRFSSILHRSLRGKNKHLIVYWCDLISLSVV